MQLRFAGKDRMGVYGSFGRVLHRGLPDDGRAFGYAAFYLMHDEVMKDFLSPLRV